MADISNYLENELIDHVLRNSAWATPGTSIYVALFTSDPTDADIGTEVTGGGYAREQCSGWDAPVNGVTSNTADVIFTQATANWGLVAYIGIYDDPSSGNLLFHAALAESKLVNNGDTFKFAAGGLGVGLA